MLNKLKGLTFLIAIYIALGITIFLIAFTKNNTAFNNRYTNNALLIIAFLAVSFSIYTMDLFSIPDVHNYAERTMLYTYTPITNLNITLSNDPLFNILQWTVAQFSESIQTFLLVVWAIIFLNITLAAKKLFKPNELLFVLFSYVSYFIFFDYVLNAIRQGLAISFLILAVSILVSKKGNKSFFLAIIIAPLMHISALPLSLALLVFKFFEVKLRTVAVIWSISLIFFITDLNYLIFGNVRSTLLDYTSTYVLGDVGQASNRLDFLLFSVFFALVGFLLWKYSADKEEEYTQLFKYYLLLNSYFLLLGFINFSDRLAAYSWMLVPLIVWCGIRGTTNFRYKRLILVSAFFVSAILLGSFSYILKS